LVVVVLPRCTQMLMLERQRQAEVVLQQEMRRAQELKQAQAVRRPLRPFWRPS
jgi:hypothetical protein